MLDDAGSALDADEVYQRTGGNPFYVTEVLAAGSEHVPTTVRDAVLAALRAGDPKHFPPVAAVGAGENGTNGDLSTTPTGTPSAG